MISKSRKVNIVKDNIKNNNSLPLSGNLFKKNKRRISFAKLFKLGFLFASFIMITLSILYVISTNNKSAAESINQELVLSELRKSIILPENIPNNMFRVSDSKVLSTQNDFYTNVKNGDYIIVYEEIQLIYDFENKLIKKIKTR